VGRILLDTVSESILNFVFFLLKFAAWGVQWTAALIVFLAVMAASGYYVFMETLDGGEPVQVPNITNLPWEEAQTRLAEQGLEMGKPVQISHDTLPKYHIISQRPAPGRVVRTGRKVYPTVSMGKDFLTAPNLLKKPLDDVRNEITQAQFRLGSVARIAHASARNTVIAQDPPAGGQLGKQGSIHLLVSDGDGRAEDYMPDLRGRPVSEIAALMAPFKVVLAPNIVTTPDAKVDVVLNQDPAPATLISAGQVVTYDVKPSSQTPTLPDSRQRGEVTHKMAFDYFDKQLRIERVDPDGNRQVLHSFMPDFSDKGRAERVIGSGLRIPVTYVGTCTVEVIVNGNVIAAYEFKNGEAPVNVTASR